MRLVDLMPRWVDQHVFVFLCPHCREVFLTCKDIVMSRWLQCEIIAADALGHQGVTVVLSKESFAWTLEGRDFARMTVSPSIDASASGHWHGRIIEGKIL